MKNKLRNICIHNRAKPCGYNNRKCGKMPTTKMYRRRNSNKSMHIKYKNPINKSLKWDIVFYPLN